MGYIHHVLIFVAYMLLNPILVNCDRYDITKVECPLGSHYNPRECCLASLEAYTVDYTDNGKERDFVYQVQHGIYQYAVWGETRALQNKTGSYAKDSKNKCQFFSKPIEAEQATKCKFSTGQNSVFKGCYTLEDDRRILEGWSDPGVNNALVLLRRENATSSCFRVFDIVTESGGIKNYFGYDKIKRKDFYTDSVIDGIFNYCV